MTTEQLLAFCAFAVITLVTPGPNNMMVLASGLNYGFVRTLPHLAGIAFGFALMVFLTGAGLHSVFVKFPLIHTVLKYVGAAYLLWLAWHLARSGPMDDERRGRERPMGFIGAAAFQWVNPKAWVMGVGAISTYLPKASHLPDVALLALIFGILGAPCIGLWAGFGVAMRRVLTDARSVRIFNGVAAALLVASLYPILID
ncbi:LysE family translocator [Pandoraea pnomenusa]|uniref:LysE family translocator n=1 Tax=Pandoraea pnomenusa TaxID=93220 RepID=UPI00333E4E81